MKKDFPFFLAFTLNYNEIVEALILSKRVELDQQDVDGNTALILGILYFHINSIIMSFPLLAFLNDKLNDAEKLLIANKLLNAGANVSITNKANQDAIKIGKNISILVK